MTSVVSLRAFANSANVPLLVLVDTQQEYLAEPRLLAFSGADAALVNCRQVLDHSRRIGLPVAFMRMVGEPVFFDRARPFTRWIDGFEPCRNEMIFEHGSPSCYSCEPFAASMDRSRGRIVMAGLVDELSCLSTPMDEFRRKPRVAYLCDASASHALHEMSADDVDHAVSTSSSVYADVCDSAGWIAATTPERLGNSKQANGMSAGG